MLSYLRNVGDYMELYQNLWNQTKEILAESFSEDTFNEIFGEVKKVVKFENGIIYVLTPSTFVTSSLVTAS